MTALTDDLNEYASGEQHTESTWIDVAVHASRVLNEADDVVFVTPDELAEGGSTVDHARGDGKRIVVVPGKVAAKLAGETNASGQPIRTLERYKREWEDSFEFHFIEIDELDEAELATYRTLDRLLELVGVEHGRWEVLVTETMRPGMPDREAGLWQPSDRRIVIRRDQLHDLADWSATFLHEVAHARSGADDATIEFEQHLTELLGRLAATVLTLDAATP